MEIGIVSDSLGALSRVDAFKAAAEMGVETVELATGNWSSAPHTDIDALVSSKDARDQLMGEIADAGLRLEALNCSGNQLHPTEGAAHDKVVHQTFELAELLDIKTVVMMSGLPAKKGDTFPAWITSVWPPENLQLLDYQWNEVAIPYWKELVKDAHARGVEKLAVEMHGAQLVYAPPGLLRLREEVGDEIIGANFDPSHLMWMGADPIASVEALSGMIYHVHAKDTRIEEPVSWRSRLETLPNPETDKRSWNFVAVGTGWPGGSGFWGELADALRNAGYDGPLSIENEDYTLEALDSVQTAVTTLKEALGR